MFCFVGSLHPSTSWTIDESTLRLIGRGWHAWPFLLRSRSRRLVGETWHSFRLCGSRDCKQKDKASIRAYKQLTCRRSCLARSFAQISSLILVASALVPCRGTNQGNDSPKTIVIRFRCCVLVQLQRRYWEQKKSVLSMRLRMHPQHRRLRGHNTGTLSRRPRHLSGVFRPVSNGRCPRCRSLESTAAWPSVPRSPHRARQLLAAGHVIVQSSIQSTPSSATAIVLLVSSFCSQSINCSVIRVCFLGAFRDFEVAEAQQQLHAPTATRWAGEGPPCSHAHLILTDASQNSSSAFVAGFSRSG